VRKRMVNVLETFETRAFSLMHGLVWIVMLSAFCLLGSLYLPSALGSVGEFPWQLLVLAAIGISFIILFTMAAFPKVVIDKDGVLLKMGFMSLFFTFDEVRVQAEGSVLRLGNWMVGGWYIPFRQKECMKAVEHLMGVYPVKVPKRVSPTFLLYLLPIPILSLIELFLRHLDIMLNPMVQALLWGFTVAFSMTMFAYKSPAKMKMGKLNKVNSSILFGLAIGITVFIIFVLR